MSLKLNKGDRVVYSQSHFAFENDPDLYGRHGTVDVKPASNCAFVIFDGYERRLVLIDCLEREQTCNHGSP